MRQKELYLSPETEVMELKLEGVVAASAIYRLTGRHRGREQVPETPGAASSPGRRKAGKT